MIHFFRLASRLNYTLASSLPYFLLNTHKEISGNLQSPSSSSPTIFTPKTRLKSAPRLKTSFTHSSRSLGRLLKFNFSTFNVEEYFPNAYAISSMEALNLFMEGQREYYGHDNPQRALELFQKAIDLEPHNIEFIFQIARFFNSEGQIPRYHTILQRMLKLSETEARTLIIKKLLWSTYMISGNQAQSQKIESEFKAPKHKAFFELQRPSMLLRAHDPSFFKYSLVQIKGDIFLRDNKPQIAMKYYRKVVDHLDEVKPQNRYLLVACADRLLNLAESHGDSKTVILCVQKLLQIYRYKNVSSNHVVYIILEGIIDQHSGRYKQAIQKYQKCGKLGSQATTDTLKRIMDCYVLLKDHENVLAQGKLFLEKYGDDHQHSYHYYRRLIEVCTDLKRFDEALVYAERIQDKMDNIEFYIMKYDIYVEAKDLDKAVECLDIILNNSENPEQQRMALKCRITCNQQLGRLDLVLTDMNKSIKSHKDDKGEDEVFYQLIKGRGQTYFNLKRYQEALGDFQKALRHGEDQEALYGGSRCLEQLGEKEKARGIYLSLKKGIDEGTSTMREEIQAELLKILSK